MVRELAASTGRKKRHLRPRCSFAVRDGDGVQINAPSDAKLRVIQKVDRLPKEWKAFLK
jgi:hypothetical protein